MSTPQLAALSGVRVIDLTTVIFGPYATQMLADYGADVIKIEAPGGDSTRQSGVARESGMASLFLGANRNKRSVVLDLKQDAARQALLALVDEADVFIHNVRPQKLERLGLGPAVLCARNPRLVFAGLHGFGEGGPYAGLPAYDDVIQAMSGAADLVQRQSGQLGYFPTVAADKISAHMAVHAVLAALFQRQHTGRGQVIEIPMYECMVSFLLTEHFYARHLARPGEAAPPRVDEFGYPRAVASWRRPYRTADGSLCLMPYTDQNWRSFFEAVGRPDLAADQRFANISGRTRHISELLQTVADIVCTRDTAHWLALCARLDIPCAPVQLLETLEADPHLEAVDMFQDLPLPDGDSLRFVRSPVRMRDSRVPLRAPPRLGEHNAEILSSLPLPADVLGPLIDPPVGGSPTADI